MMPSLKCKTRLGIFFFFSATKLSSVMSTTSTMLSAEASVAAARLDGDNVWKKQHKLV